MSRGHIRRRGKNSWSLKFDLGRDPLTGRRVTKYSTFRGPKKKAQEELTRLLNQRDQGSYIEPTKMTVAQYLHHWLEADIDRRVAARTAIRHRGIVEKNIIPNLGHVPLRKLTAVHIEAFEADLQRRGWVKPRAKPAATIENSPPDRGLSAQTVQHVHRTLSQALSHAVRLGVLFKNPAQQVKPPRVTQREIKILEKNEIGTLLEFARRGDLYLPVLVALSTGVRRGELLGLRWSDIDEANAVIRIERAQWHGIVGETKTGNVRTVPLTAELAEVLRDLRATTRGGAGWVFANEDGGLLGPCALRFPLRRVLKRAGITKRVSVHGLRRTFNNLSRQVAGVIVTRAITGHVTEEMTEHYSHVDRAEKLRAADQVVALAGLRNAANDNTTPPNVPASGGSGGGLN